jgi:hypothetical protein
MMAAHKQTPDEGGRMGKQIFKCVVAVALIVGVVGCASYPPPIILPNKATNFKYQYSVDIPQGWDVYEKFPKDIGRTIPQSFKKIVTLVMINKVSGGIIAVANDKRRKNFQDLLNTPGRKIREILPMMKETLEKDNKVSRWDSQVSIESLSATHRNYNANASSFKSEAVYEIEVDMVYSIQDVTAGMDWFIYPCHRTNFCQTMVILICEKDKFETNRPAFESVVESLTMHDVPTD